MRRAVEVTDVSSLPCCTFIIIIMEPVPPPEPFKMQVVIFYYEKGKSGNDYLNKEVCKVPVRPKEFDSLIKFKEYVR